MPILYVSLWFNIQKAVRVGVTKIQLLFSMQLCYTFLEVKYMPTKEMLLEKISRKPTPTNFTIRELDALMKKCGCEKFQGGRGSGIGYFHTATKRILQFDGPHPGKELYRYQIKKVIQFLKDLKEL